MKILKGHFWVIILALLIFIRCAPNKKLTQGQGASQEIKNDSVPKDTGQIKLLPPVYRSSRTRLSDILHTKLEISLDWKNRCVNGIATLTLKPYFYPQNQLVLDAKSFDIHSINLLKGTEQKELKYFNEGTLLYITLDTLYSRDQEYQIKIDYTARPREQNSNIGGAIESDQGFYFIDPDDTDPKILRQVWTQGEPEYNSCWFPTIDSPNERTTGEIYITVEDNFVTLSNGILVYSRSNNNGTRTDYWKMDLPIAPYLFVVAAGEFSIVKDQWQDIPLYYYVEPAYAPYAKEIFGRTPEMISFFSKILGYKYPWPKYSQIIVREFVTGAMENTTATVFYDDLLKDSHELIDGNDDNTIAHELFHHWFGDLVTCESWSNLPLNESFANYAEYLWNEHQYGPFEADLHAMDERNQYFDEAKTKQADLIRFYYNDPNDMFDSHSYSKGGLILHMLRKYVGDEAFFKALHLYLERNKFSSVEVQNLRLAFEEITGEDLNWFFNEWFMASGHPILKVDEAFSDGKEKITVNQLQDPNTTPVYRLPLYIDIWSGGNKIRFHVNIDKANQAFEFDLPSKPDLVMFDGDQQLLAKVMQAKDINQYIYQYYHSDLFYPKFEALDTLNDLITDNNVRKVLIDALSDNFWYFRQMAIDAFENYTGTDSTIVMNKANDMAIHDSSSLVRADAINTLYSVGGNRFRDTYKAALNDTSYAVMGSALYAFMQSAPSEVPVLVKRFENFNSLYIAIPIASYYIDHGDQSKYDWFVQKMDKMKSEGLWYMLQYFGEFLMKSPVLDQRKGIVVLEQYARHHKSMYVRMAAYQGLGLLMELSGVKEMREDIRKNEKDDNLKKVYQSMN